MTVRGDTVVLTRFPATAPRMVLADTAITLLGTGDDYLDRIYYARRSEDGRILLSMGLTQLRVYGADGTLESSLGRDGSGPGEFEFLWDAHWVSTDTVVAYDPRRRRMMFYDALSGDLLSESELTSLWVSPNGIQPVGGGDHVGVRTSPELQGGEVFLYEIAEDESRPLVSLHYPDFDTSPVREGGPMRWVTINSGASRTGTWFGARHTSVMQHRSLSGELKATLDLRSLASDDRGAWDKVIVAPDGSAWIRLTETAEADSIQWLLVDDRGYPFAQTRLPASSRLIEVGEDAVVLRERDDFDVETIAVRVFEIARPD